MSFRPKTSTFSPIACLVVCSLAFGQGEIEKPAGDLPSDSQEESQDDEATGPEPEKIKKGQDASSKQRDAETSEAVTWESYSNNVGSVAQEVTRGVRVEDIVEPPSEYRYAAFGRSDPFVPPMVSTEDQLAQKADPLEIPIVSPLQRFGIDQLKVVGIWQVQSGERKAMVMTPDNVGQGIIIKAGDPIGNRGGKVLGIGDDFVTVREFMLAPDGTRQYEDQQLYMGKRDQDDVLGKIRFTPGKEKTELILESTKSAAPAPATESGPKNPFGAIPPMFDPRAVNARDQVGNAAPTAFNLGGPKDQTSYGAYVPAGGSGPKNPAQDAPLDAQRAAAALMYAKQMQEAANAPLPSSSGSNPFPPSVSQNPFAPR